MLQYPVQLPPLSLSSQKISAAPAKDFEYARPNDPSPQNPSSALLNRKRLSKDPFVSRSSVLSSSFHPQPLSPLSISTNLPSSFQSSPSVASANLPRSPYLSSRQLQLPSPLPFAHKDTKSPSDSLSITSQAVEDVLAPGDVVGEGFFLQGDLIRLVSNGAPDHQHREPARELEVIKQLGTGSYAVVYLVQEVLSRPVVSEDGHMSTIGLMEFDNKPLPPAHVVYGRKYAIKCLSKANLDEEALAIQMSEVTIHQSLHLHPNIVTLHRTLETSAFLLLLLEYVPGEDLFYFLEQARDHHEMDNAHHTDSSVSASHTPPTPSLLSNLHPSQLLSRTRLRLISSMFSQMCDAVAACHSQQVFHRDIKPENFIVTDGTFTAPDGRFERKVIVKLTDFGLSTTDLESADMDCGSAPYMSYECRNNVAPTYRPRAADVWSLGIVLINMLYHFNPWTDTAQGSCSSFDLYLKDPVNFFMQRFMGMTRPVAEVLANKVFCILPDPQNDSPRMSAAEFGAWSKNLPNLLGAHVVHRTVSNSSQGHRISQSFPLSHRPSSRQASVCTTAARTPAIPVRSLSRAPSLEPAFEREELSTVIDQDNEDDVDDADGEIDIEGMTSRSTSTNKRRKRGARKGKGAIVVAGVTSPPTPQDNTLVTLAVASQSLAREISKASRSSSHRSVSINASSSRSRMNFEPVSMYAMPTAIITNNSRHPVPSTSVAAVTAAPPVIPSPVTKKPSKWKLSFGKSSASTLANAAAAGRVSPVEEVSLPSLDLSPSQAMATTASNVTSLLMGLNAPPPNPAPAAPLVKLDNDASSTWSRGRRARDVQLPTTAKNPSKSPGHAITATHPPSSSNLSAEQWTFHERTSDRAVSPNSTRSGRPVASSASSVVSSNWRSSMSTSSSAGTSTSAFTRYSNSSARSISTTATSVSSASWRTSVKPSSTFSSSTGYSHGNLPKNIKIMDGVPWELDQLPRGQHPNPVGDIFGSPPVRKQRTRKPKDLKLDTITERPAIPTTAQKSPGMRRDASTSTTDLTGLAGGKEDVEGVKKVQKGQINALAKMLSALRR
ncbi:hypothetical protein CVT25_012165 [Psilocybe cyanescens]|uniref:Protein kinase domain-containing protein n=1 Tax=Psilocybe cyanescens TaxID=93625 RepID=A0A409XFE6_PSICY|nr:hypothetical protein CVT25_012165 [Psilocybe cyanescens]